jgi:glycosyltransferase involved in cell wall biosynthesis
LYNLLSDLPYETLLITSDRTIKGDIIEPKEEYFNNIRVKRFSMYSNNAFFRMAPLRYLHTIYQKPMIIIDTAKSEQFDIIHTHALSFFGQAAKKLSKKLNKPFVVELHIPPEDVFGLGNGVFNFFYLEGWHRKLLKSCNCVITLTQALKNSMCSKYKIPNKKIAVIPNGVNVNIFSSSTEYEKKAGEIKERFGLSNSIVMYAGFIDRVNGLIDFANVIPSIIAEKPDTHFLFIGHGPEEGRIIALSKKYLQVKFLPMVHYNEMPIYYQMCDVFVIPRPSTLSAETLTPLKLLEVMAMEKPVLGSNVGGIAEVIKHGENGYLFEKGNTESFKKTLLEVLDMDNTQIGKNARKTIVDNYTWDKSAKILQEVYEDLV